MTVCVFKERRRTSW